MKKALLISLIFLNLEVYSQVPTYVPSDGLIGYWSFSGNANDISGNGNNGTPTNVSLTTDRFGSVNSAYLFDGSSSRIDVNNSFFNVGLNAFTISCWTYSMSLLNPNNYNDSQIVFNTSPHNGIAMSMYGNNNPFFTAWNNKYVFLAGSQPEQRSWDVVFMNGNTNVDRTINTWNHLVLIKDGNNYRFYINGILENSVIGTTTPNSYLCKIVIGGLSSDIPAEVFLGKLDDYAIWNRALSQTEVNIMYNSSSCLNQLVLTSPEDDFLQGNYMKTVSATNGRIIATNKILNSAKVNYQASSIQLNAGFKADRGTVFEVEIGGCN